VKRNHVVAEQAVNWPYVGIVERGVVQASLATPAGREQTMYEILPHDVFGEVALLDGGHTPLRFIAVTADTSVLLLPSDSVRSLAERFPSVSRALSIAAAQHFRVVLDHFGAHLSQSTTARVAHALLPYALPDEGMSAVLEPLPSLTQNEIAMRAGTVKEVVSRALAELEGVGALERKGGHIVGLNRAKLIEAAQANP
jgi:CRP/FNR family transcriptional regulator